jgi:DNA mismatch endonuclease (patch repair protein)
MVFPGSRVAVFTDGCFWHSCPEHATQPKANESWWAGKLRRNAERDQETNAHLASLGWLALRFWEHEDAKEIVDVVENAVRSRS